jgi:hypothetical protein
MGRKWRKADEDQPWARRKDGLPGDLPLLNSTERIRRREVAERFKKLEGRNENEKELHETGKELSTPKTGVSG